MTAIPISGRYPLYEDGSSPVSPIKFLAVSEFHQRFLGNLSTSLKTGYGMIEELGLDLISDDDCSLDYCSVSEEEE